MTLTCIAPTGDVCGEAATWDAASQTLWWVDINRFLLHALQRGAVRTWIFEEPVVALSLTTGDRLLVALASSVMLWSPEDGGREELARLDGWPMQRLNDGRTDPSGRFWVGSMANNVGPDGESQELRKDEGKLFRLGAGLKLREANIGIANTLCWSPDRSTFYFGDTLRNEIRAYRYDDPTGEIGEGRAFFAGFRRGAPDGSAIDAEGYLWNCRYGGACVVRIAPDGSIDRIVEMPCTNITTCCFGGPDLGTLFITTAAAGRGPKERLAGSVFALDSGARGLPENRFDPASIG